MDAPVYARRVFIGVSADELWNALVNPETVKEYWLCPLIRLEPFDGGRVQYGAGDQPTIVGEILRYEPAELLSHTFQFVRHPNDPRTRVTYQIEPMDGMCLLRLTHDGFPGMNETYFDVTQGWDVILSSLKTLLETGKQLPWPGRRYIIDVA